MAKSFFNHCTSTKWGATDITKWAELRSPPLHINIPTLEHK